jgi:hypothetical protein
MTDDRSLERAARSWLEVGPTEAPARAVEAALLRIETTPQERDWHVPWRLPKMTSPVRVATAAVIAVLAVGGALFVLGRSTGVGTPAATPSPTPTIATPTSPAPAASAATLESYRAARDAICTPAVTRVIALNGQLDILKPADSPEDLASSITLLEQIIVIETDTTDQLATLTPPPALAADHAADVTHHRDSLAMMAEAMSKLRAGQVTESNAIGDAINSLSALEESYEQANALAGCP